LRFFCLIMNALRYWYGFKYIFCSIEWTGIYNIIIVNKLPQLKDKPTYAIDRLTSLIKKRVLILLAGSGFYIASAAIIVVNYYSIRMLSGTRAYINGESEYSKGQKRMLRPILSIIFISENEQDYKLFERAISIPQGDYIARLAFNFC